MRNMFIMLNRFTKIGWLFGVIFAILSYGCSTSPHDDSGVSMVSGGKDRPPKYAYAIELIKRKDFNKAEDVLLNLEPTYKNPDLYTNIAIININKKNIDKAKTYIEKSIALNPNNYISQNVYGVVLRKMGKFDDAVKAYSTSISKNSDYADAYLNMAILYDIYIDSPKKALPYYEKYMALADNDKNIKKWIVEVKRRAK